ncbi:hypothetical protein NHG22_14645, partial [Streptomyces sp. ATE26]
RREAQADKPAIDEASLVAQLRARLSQIARSKGLINWETLIGYTGLTPDDFTPEDRVRILVAVDSPSAPDKPVLSSMVKLAGQQPGLPPFFTEVLTGLGREVDLRDDRLIKSTWERLREAAHAAQWDDTPLTPVPPATMGLPISDEELVERFRRHLERVARSRSVMKWSTLLRHAGVSASAISPRDRIRLLAAMDTPYGSDRPVLSSLVKQEGQKDGPAPFFEKVLDELGWAPSPMCRTVAVAWTTERERAYALFGKPGTRAGEIWIRPGTSLETVIQAVRKTLISAARRHVSVSWRTLAAAAGLAPNDLSEKARTAILVAVDRPAGSNGVLLSSLVISTENTPVPYFAEILKRLGRPHSSRPIELGRIRKAEQARAFAAYGSGPVSDTNSTNHDQPSRAIEK